jgi:hypothetical protein
MEGAKVDNYAVVVEEMNSDVPRIECLCADYVHH